jgi:hypothetical protein
VRRTIVAAILIGLLILVASTAAIAWIAYIHYAHPIATITPDPAWPQGPAILFATDTPSALLDKATAALGGPERLGRWKCGRVKYQTRSDTIPLLSDKPSIVEEYFHFPGHFKRTAEIGHGARRRTVTFIGNNDQGWEIQADGSCRSVPEIAVATLLRSEHPFADFYNLARLRAANFHLSLRGESPVAGRTAVVLHADNDYGNPVDFAFDCATALLVKSTRHLPRPSGGETTVEIYLGDYRDIGGGPVPLHIVGHGDGKVLLDFTIYELQFIDRLDESLFKVDNSQ